MRIRTPVLLVVCFVLASGCAAPDDQREPTASPEPPIAAKQPKELEAHGDVRVDDYYWLREREIDSNEGRARIDKAGQIAGLAKELGTAPAKLAIAWCLKNPNVSTVILGASRVEQLQQNLEALDAVPLLTDEVMERIEGILRNKPELPQQF